MIGDICVRWLQPVRDAAIIERYKALDQKPLASIDRSRQNFVGQRPTFFQDHPLESGAPLSGWSQCVSLD